MKRVWRHNHGGYNNDHSDPEQLAVKDAQEYVSHCPCEEYWRQWKGTTGEQGANDAQRERHFKNSKVVNTNIMHRHLIATRL